MTDKVLLILIEVKRTVNTVKIISIMKMIAAIYSKEI